MASVPICVFQVMLGFYWSAFLLVEARNYQHILTYGGTLASPPEMDKSPWTPISNPYGSPTGSYATGRGLPVSSNQPSNYMTPSVPVAAAAAAAPVSAPVSVPVSVPAAAPVSSPDTLWSTSQAAPPLKIVPYWMRPSNSMQLPSSNGPNPWSLPESVSTDAMSAVMPQSEAAADSNPIAAATPPISPPMAMPMVQPGLILPPPPSLDSPVPDSATMSETAPSPSSNPSQNPTVQAAIVLPSAPTSDSASSNFTTLPEPTAIAAPLGETSNSSDTAKTPKTLVPSSRENWPETPRVVAAADQIPPLPPATFGQFAVPPAG